MKHTHLLLLCLAAMLFLSVGYAALSDELTITGNVQVSGSSYDIYIESVERVSGISVADKPSYAGTVLTAQTTTTSGSTAFEITIKNASDKTYVFERVIDGAETGVPGVYDESEIPYTYTVLTPMVTSLAPGESVTFTLTINNSNGVETSNYVLDFHFIEKTGTEILPDGEETTTSSGQDEETTTSPNQGGDDNEPETEPVYSDFRGLVQAILSEQALCLNDKTSDPDYIIDNVNRSDVVKNDPPILHCTASSGMKKNMQKVLETVNAELSEQLLFILVYDASNPKNHITMYMYYADHLGNSSLDSEILVYRQELRRADENSRWYDDGTYIGRATVANLHGGANNVKNVKTIDPTTWKSGAPTTASEP